MTSTTGIIVFYIHPHNHSLTTLFGKVAPFSDRLHVFFNFNVEIFPVSLKEAQRQSNPESMPFHKAYRPDDLHHSWRLIPTYNVLPAVKSGRLNWEVNWTAPWNALFNALDDAWMNQRAIGFLHSQPTVVDQRLWTVIQLWILPTTAAFYTFPPSFIPYWFWSFLRLPSI